jgi:hypothetical protein
MADWIYESHGKLPVAFLVVLESIHPHPEEEREYSPSPQSSPLKGEEDQGKGIHRKRTIE